MKKGKFLYTVGLIYITQLQKVLNNISYMMLEGESVVDNFDKLFDVLLAFDVLRAQIKGQLGGHHGVQNDPA